MHLTEEQCPAGAKRFRVYVARQTRLGLPAFDALSIAPSILDIAQPCLLRKPNLRISNTMAWPEQRSYAWHRQIIGRAGSLISRWTLSLRRAHVPFFTAELWTRRRRSRGYAGIRNAFKQGLKPGRHS